MRAVMTSTNRFVDLPHGGGKPRVWEGMTDSGIPFIAYITAVHVSAGEDAAAFTRELKQSGAPSIAAENAIAAAGSSAEARSVQQPWPLASAMKPAADVAAPVESNEPAKPDRANRRRGGES